MSFPRRCPGGIHQVSDTGGAPGSAVPPSCPPVRAPLAFRQARTRAGPSAPSPHDHRAPGCSTLRARTHQSPGAPRRRRVTAPPDPSGSPRRGHREAYLPAQQPSSGPTPRVPPPHGGPRRSCRAEGAPPQGPEQAVGLIWRIRDRATFVDLRRGRRVRSGPIWISYCPDEPLEPPRPPRVAFAFGRRQGNAVNRNRLRRRSRAILEEIQRSAPGIPPGAYLVGGSPDVASLTFAELRRHLRACVDRIDAA